MRPSPTRVAQRWLSRKANAVRVEVNPKATERAISKFGPGIAVGKFLSPVPLFRVFDGEELRGILDTGEIKGGSYSVKGERAYGAQWGTDKGAIAQWGERQRGKRLGHELFMAQIDGQGRVFAHLSGADGLLKPDSGVVELDASFCHTGLGCSVHVGMSDVDRWFIVEDGKPIPTPLAELRELSTSVGLTPREVDLHKGALLKGLPAKVQKALRYELFNEENKFQDGRRLDTWELAKLERDAGISGRDRMEGDRLGRLLLKYVCASDDCGTWSTSDAQAERDATPGSSDGDRSFAAHVALTATVATPHYIADLHGVEATVKYVDVFMPNRRRWHRIWQPWGSAKFTVVDSGQIVVR